MILQFLTQIANQCHGALDDMNVAMALLHDGDENVREIVVPWCAGHFDKVIGREREWLIGRDNFHGHCARRGHLGFLQHWLKLGSDTWAGETSRAAFRQFSAGHRSMGLRMRGSRWLFATFNTEMAGPGFTARTP